MKYKDLKEEEKRELAGRFALAKSLNGELTRGLGGLTEEEALVEYQRRLEARRREQNGEIPWQKQT